MSMQNVYTTKLIEKKDEVLGILNAHYKVHNKEEIFKILEDLFEGTIFIDDYFKLIAKKLKVSQAEALSLGNEILEKIFPEEIKRLDELFFNHVKDSRVFLEQYSFQMVFELAYGEPLVKNAENNEKIKKLFQYLIGEIDQDEFYDFLTKPKKFKGLELLQAKAEQVIDKIYEVAEKVLYYRKEDEIYKKTLDEILEYGFRLEEIAPGINKDIEDITKKMKEKFNIDIVEDYNNNINTRWIFDTISLEDEGSHEIALIQDKDNSLETTVKDIHKELGLDE